MLLVSSCNFLCRINWSQVVSREWRCSWSSADRRCSNYIWEINNCVAYQGAFYVRGLTVVLCSKHSEKISQVHCQLIKLIKQQPWNSPYTFRKLSYAWWYWANIKAWQWTNMTPPSEDCVNITILIAVLLIHIFGCMVTIRFTDGRALVIYENYCQSSQNPDLIRYSPTERYLHEIDRTNNRYNYSSFGSDAKHRINWYISP